MDPFQDLPVDIIGLILKQLSDLPTLYFLTHASPFIALVLHQDQALAVFIIEEIIAHPRTPTGIQFIIRTIALIRLQSQLGRKTKSIQEEKQISLLPTTLEDFTTQLDASYPMSFSMSLKPLAISPGDSLYGTAPLSKTLYPSVALLLVSPRFLYRLLALSAYVRIITRTITQSLLGRCHALRPSHPANPKYRFKYPFTFEIFLRGFHAEPGPSYTPVDSGPPSWTEESRVSFAVWRIVLYFEMRNTYLDTGLSSAWGLDWGDAVARKHEGLAVLQFWRKIIDRTHGLYDLETVAEWMFPEAIGTYEAESWVEPPSPSLVLSRRQHESCCYSLINEPTLKEEWCHVYEQDQDHQSRTAFRYITSDMLGYEWGLLNTVDFEVFRPYGFSIWDTKRIAAWELWQMNLARKGSLISDSKLWFTWKSILSKKQVEEHEEKRRKSIGDSPWKLQN